MSTIPFIGGALTAAVAAILIALAVHRREWRGGLFALGMMFIAVTANEWSVRIPGFSDCFHDEPELSAILTFLLAGLFGVVRWRGSTVASFAEIVRNRRFYLLVLGLLAVSALPNLVRNRHLWQFVAPGLPYARQSANVLQDCAKGTGHLLLVLWAALFVKDVWSRIVHRASPHEHLLHEHPLVEIGRGARRICYRIGDTDYCVKFLRDAASYADGRKCGWHHRWALRYDSFDRFRNLNCREAEAMETYRSKGGPAVAAALPETVEIVYDERRGYGVLMSCLANADGTPVRSAVEEMARRRDPAFAEVCYRQMQSLLKDLAACSAPFFEPDNFQSQTLPDGSVRIRMVDFEPCEKKLIPLGEYVPSIRRLNLRRRTHRILGRISDTFGCGVAMDGCVEDGEKTL